MKGHKKKRLPLFSPGSRDPGREYRHPVPADKGAADECVHGKAVNGSRPVSGEFPGAEKSGFPEQKSPGKAEPGNSLKT